MPFGSEGVQAGIGLALSGGGFRATLFHIGAVWRLVELGVLTSLTQSLQRVGRLDFCRRSCVILEEFVQSPTVANYRQLVVDPLRRFCQQQIDTIAIGEGLLSPWTSIGEAIESKYQAELFQSGLINYPTRLGLYSMRPICKQDEAFVFPRRTWATIWSALFAIRQRHSPKQSQRQVRSLRFFRRALLLDPPSAFEAVPGALFNGNPNYTTRLY